MDSEIFNMYTADTHYMNGGASSDPTMKLHIFKIWNERLHEN